MNAKQLVDTPKSIIGALASYLKSTYSAAGSQNACFARFIVESKRFKGNGIR